MLAAQWYARAAELGDPEGMFAYGLLLAEGNGVAKNRDAAAQMFEAAAGHKHALANYNLALLFLKGEGKPENPYRALAHMLFAADALGAAAAQYDLGTLYATGTGTEPNAFEKREWIGKAAAAGHTEGAGRLRRDPVPRPWRAARPQGRGPALRAAAEKGMAVAQNRLARCYAHAAGVEANLVEAVKWHLIAKASGYDDSLDKSRPSSPRPTAPRPRRPPTSGAIGCRSASSRALGLGGPAAISWSVARSDSRCPSGRRPSSELRRKTCRRAPHLHRLGAVAARLLEHDPEILAHPVDGKTELELARFMVF